VTSARWNKQLLAVHAGMFGEFGRKQEKRRKSALTGELPDVD